MSGEYQPSAVREHADVALEMHMPTKPARCVPYIATHTYTWDSYTHRNKQTHVPTYSTTAALSHI